uniref:Uncharacterized protein n=1 Tax=Kalanchoe fedtschenkoi TaxID=63787 RepID=A0A7N0VLS6_KALFE
MDMSYSIDVDKLTTFGDDLSECLKDGKDFNNLAMCLKHSAPLQSSCNSDYNGILSSIQDYQKKINACKRQCEKTISEVIDDLEITSLERELADEEKREKSVGEELR